VGIVCFVAFLSTAIITYLSKQPNQQGELPIVYENEFPEENYDNVELPESDSDGEVIDIAIEDLPSMSEEDIAAIEQQEEEQGNDIYIDEQDIQKINDTIEEAKKEAEEYENVQPVEMEPIPTVTPEPEPQRDAEGYIYTKEEAIENFRTEYQKQIDNNRRAYVGSREAALREGFTEEDFEKNVYKMMNDPYSSPQLSNLFNSYRKNGDLGLLIVGCAEWLGIGGDEGKVADRIVR
jgi:hypothetical protein